MAKNPQVAQYKQWASEAERRYGLPAGVMSGLIEQESSWNPKAQSGAGAIGLTQIVPKWHPTVDAKRLTTDPAYSINEGARILAERYKARKGDIALSLADYNGGQGNVDKWLKGKDLAQETRQYAPLVLARANKYGGSLTEGDMDGLMKRFSPKMQMATLMKKANIAGQVQTARASEPTGPVEAVQPTAVMPNTAQVAFNAPSQTAPSNQPFDLPIEQPIDLFEAPLSAQLDQQPEMPEMEFQDFSPPKPISTDIFAGDDFKPKFDFNTIRNDVESAYKIDSPKMQEIPKALDSYLNSFVSSLRG